MFSAGAFLIHLYYLNSYKKEFKLFLKQNKVQNAQAIIYINPHELYTNSDKIIWEDENKEVIYKGVLYDILEIKNAGLRVALIAVSDAKEMILKKQFSELYNVNEHQSTKNPFHLLKHFLGLKTIMNSITICCDAYASEGVMIHTPGFFRITSVFISEDTPPPDFLS